MYPNVAIVKLSSLRLVRLVRLTSLLLPSQQKILCTRSFSAKLDCLIILCTRGGILSVNLFNISEAKFTPYPFNSHVCAVSEIGDGAIFSCITDLNEIIMFNLHTGGV